MIKVLKRHKEFLRKLFSVAARKYDSYSVDEKVNVIRDLFPEYRDSEQKVLVKVVKEVTVLLN